MAGELEYLIPNLSLRKWLRSLIQKRRIRCNFVLLLIGACNVILIGLIYRMLDVKVPVVRQQTVECERTFDLDIRLGRWDRQHRLKMFDQALVGEEFSKLSEEYPVCLATQTPLDKIDELIDIVRNWNGSISLAVIVVGNEEYLILQQYVAFLMECFPEVRERVSFQLAFPKEKIPKSWCSSKAQTVFDCKKPEITLNHLLAMRSDDTIDWRSEYSYPQNHLRNLARKNCRSGHVLLTEIDVIPRAGMAEQLREFINNNKDRKKSAYVIPTYEMSYVAPFPKDKKQLLKHVRKGLARPLHYGTMAETQAATDFPKWENDLATEIHVSYEVKHIRYPYEPFYVAPDDAPPLDETFLGHGSTTNTQVYEMYEDGWRFYVLSPTFMVHHGLPRDKIPAWKGVERSYNRENIQHFKKAVLERYQMRKRKQSKTYPKNGDSSVLKKLPKEV